MCSPICFWPGALHRHAQPREGHGRARLVDARSAVHRLDQSASGRAFVGGHFDCLCCGRHGGGGLDTDRCPAAALLLEMRLAHAGGGDRMRPSRHSVAPWVAGVSECLDHSARPAIDGECHRMEADCDPAARSDDAVLDFAAPVRVRVRPEPTPQHSRRRCAGRSCWAGGFARAQGSPICRWRGDYRHAPLR